MGDVVSGSETWPLNSLDIDSIRLQSHKLPCQPRVAAPNEQPRIAWSDEMCFFFFEVFFLILSI